MVLSSLFVLVISQTPDWVTNPPTGYLNDYKVCYSEQPTVKLAEKDALESCIQELLLTNAIEISPSKTVLRRENSSLRLSTTLEYKTPGRQLENLKIADKSSYIDERTNSRQTYLLISTPKQNPVAPPNHLGVVSREFIFPGWGSGHIGNSKVSKGRYFNSISLLIGATVCYSAMRNAYSDANRQPSDRGLYREKAEFYRNWTFGFSVSYLLYGVYSALDVKNDDYLVRFL